MTPEVLVKFKIKGSNGQGHRLTWRVQKLAKLSLT